MSETKETKDSKANPNAKWALKQSLAYKKVFCDEVGQEVLKDLMIATGYNATSFVAGDPYMSAFREGARSIVCRIIETIETDPEKSPKRVSEIIDETEVLHD